MRAACLPPASRTSAPTFASTRRSSSRSRFPRSGSSAPASAWERPRSRRTQPGCTHATGRSSSSRWEEAARPSPRWRRSRRTSTRCSSSRAPGRHAASDYLETAALAGVETVGCRRCGGGLAGSVSISNVHQGAKLAVELAPDLVLFDGSGAAIPPIETSRRVLVVNAPTDRDVATGYLNGFRHLVSDLVVLTMAEEGSGWEELRDAAAELAPRVLATTLRPRPAEPVEGRTVAFFSTAPESAHELLAAHLRDEHGADVVHVSGQPLRPEEAASRSSSRSRPRSSSSS